MKVLLFDPDLATTQDKKSSQEWDFFLNGQVISLQTLDHFLWDNKN
jgi:hypothetical protein